MTLSAETEYTLDFDLVRQARGGDERAFEEIVRRYSPRVFRIASRFFRERANVEEVAQEVFLKTYTELGSYKGKGSLEGWIARIATNTCLNALRKSKVRREYSIGSLSAEETAWLENVAGSNPRAEMNAEHSVVAADLAEKVFARLSHEDRLVLMLLDGEEMQVREVAETTGWSQSNVKVKAMRARRKMRSIVKELLAEGKGGKGSKTA